MDFLGTATGALVGALVGVWMSHRRGNRPWSWLPREVLARRRVWTKVQCGEARLNDLGTFLQASNQGWEFLLAHTNTTTTYVAWWMNDETEKGHAFWPQACAPKEHEAVGAVVTWLRRDRDWALLAVCLEARLTPPELLAHVDGTTAVTLSQVQTLAALRAPTEQERKSG